MGLLSAIGSFISGVGSVISGAISSIGSAISGFAKSAFNLLAKLPIPGLNIVKIISMAGQIIHAVIDVLGIKSEEDPEILGAKSGQLNEKNLDDFDNDVEAYIKYLKEEVELDKERFDNMEPEERMACKAIGMALETKAIEEKIGGIEISPECLAALTKIQAAGINIDAKELVEIVQVLKERNVTNLNDVVEFLDGKGDSDRVKTGEAFAAALGDDSTTKILDLQDAVRKYEED